MGGLEDMLVPRGGSSPLTDDLVSAASGGQSGPFVCRFAADAVAGVKAQVTGGQFGTSRVTGCRWSAHVGVPDPILPEQGDTALVVFDDEGDPWVVAWWGS